MYDVDVDDKSIPTNINLWGYASLVYIFLGDARPTIVI